MSDRRDELFAAAKEYGFLPADAIDLAGTSNPHPYPIPQLAQSCWQHSAAENDGLTEAASTYYGNTKLLTIAGFPAALALLPGLFRPAAIACLTPIAEEPARAWQGAGHHLRRLPTLARLLAAATPIVVLANPNPISGATLPRDALLDAAGELERRGGWLIVDEALADAEPEHSLAALAGSAQAPRLIAVRSFEPFFGLAGAPVACVFGASEKLEPLRARLIPFALAHPVRAVARQAFADTTWQAATRAALAASSQRLAQALAPLGATQRTGLFCCVRSTHGTALFAHLARRAILTRRFTDHERLRFSLPRDESDWQRVYAAIAEWKDPA